MSAARMALRLGAVALAPLALAACGEPAQTEAAGEPTPRPTVAAPRTLIAANYDEAMHGAKIEGPQGIEVEGALMADGREVGRIVSFVACPREITTCDPSAMPEGTVYTYVHRVTLAEDAPDGAQASEAGAATAAESYATVFRTTRRASGFNGSIGYSRDQAEAALGDGEAMGITSDQGRLIWRVTRGAWTPGATITFWWQSTLPPEGPLEAWQFETEDTTATVTAPFPPAEMPVE